MPVLFDNSVIDRNLIKLKLEENGIGTRKYFYPLVTDFDCYKIFNRNNTPVSKRVSESVLCLPLYPDLDLKMVDFICNIIQKEINEHK